MRVGLDSDELCSEHRFMGEITGVTMADVARTAGVARSTVSKALRSDPSISEECRRKVRESAAALGYTPDPMVAALMARLHSRRRRNDPHHLAWIDLWPDAKEAALTTDFKLMFSGTRQRAKELGYNIEVYQVGRDQTPAARLHQILIARCQWGLIIPPVPREAMSYSLKLEGLTAVTIGTSLHEPLMHRVAPNHFQGGQLACQKLREKGYQRIGIALTSAIHERVEGKWLGAYLSEQFSWPVADRVPPLLLNRDDANDYRDWLARFAPDVVLLAEPHVESLILSSSRKPPRTAWLRILPQKSKGTPAIDTCPEKMGAAAVELLVGQIHRNERGSPPFPHTLLLQGVWEE